MKAKVISSADEADWKASEKAAKNICRFEFPAVPEPRLSADPSLGPGSGLDAGRSRRFL